MALVFKNYKPTKQKLEELEIVKVLENEDVFVDLPTAVMEFGVEYENPTIFGDYKGIPRILEAKEILEHTKMYHLTSGVEDPETKQVSVIETTKEKATWSFRLPKDTPIDQLIVIDNQILLAERLENEEK